MKFELLSDYVDILPKFTNIEDLYLFVREFEEVCLLIPMPRVSNDVMRMRFILFALKR